MSLSLSDLRMRKEPMSQHPDIRIRLGPNITPTLAMSLVNEVIERGRISDDSSYPSATVFFNHVTVYAYCTLTMDVFRVRRTEDPTP